MVQWKMDDWLLEHLAKVTSLSCVLIVIYFLIYSIWRISQMPNNPWNWNEWQWPLGGRHAVEIYRKPTEMPFTLVMGESGKDKLGECSFTLGYLKDKAPPEVSVMWGPGASYLMRLINASWQELNYELMTNELRPGEWNSLMGSGEPIPGTSSSSSMTGGPVSWKDSANYFILQRLKLDLDQEVEENKENQPLHPILSENYKSVKLKVKPPTDFDWSLLRNQFRYPAGIFVTDSNGGAGFPEAAYQINGIIQIVHIKNEVFPNASTMLAQYIKMNTGQSHVLQSLYVLDDHRTNEDDSDEEDNNGANLNDNDLNSSASQQSQHDTPFRDILCSVCQVSPVTRVIIPCRHVCLCTQCFEKVECCPICRGQIMYFFKTRQDPNSTGNSTYNSGGNQESENLTWWQRIERFNERFNDFMGLIRQY